MGNAALVEKLAGYRQFSKQSTVLTLDSFPELRGTAGD
jgi:hypothetical protein